MEPTLKSKYDLKTIHILAFACFIVASLSFCNIENPFLQLRKKY